MRRMLKILQKLNFKVMNDVAMIKEAFKELDVKYTDYLLGEGRWLGGSLGMILTSAKDKKLSNPGIAVKKEIFNMLPHHIKADIISIIQL